MSTAPKNVFSILGGNRTTSESDRRQIKKQRTAQYPVDCDTGGNENVFVRIVTGVQIATPARVKDLNSLDVDMAKFHRQSH